MSGPIEEGAKAANSFIRVMQEQPLSLALVVMNLGLLGFLYYTHITSTNERHRELDLLYENRKYVTDVLASCVHVDQIEKLLKGKQ